MTSQPIAWFDLAPIVIVLGAAVIGILIEAFAPAHLRRTIQAGLALAATGTAGGWALWLALGANGRGLRAMGGHVLLDPMALFCQVAAAFVAFIALFVILDRTADGEDAFTPQAASAPGSQYEEQARAAGLAHSEVFPLVLFATAGMMIFPAAGDLLTMFVALEVLSLPLYLLTGMARRRRLLAQEASLKYFLLGAFASAFFLFGVAWVYGATGTVSLSGIAQALTTSSLGLDPILLVGIGLIAVGLLFKVGAVPFHMWTPDVYQGAPTPITGFMAAGVKIGAFGALLRVFYTIVYPLASDLSPALWTVAILTMVVGTIIGLVQRDIKRMLAYSAIAHAGFILTGVLSLSQDGMTGVLFYLLTYGIATVGAFGVIGLVREHTADGVALGEVNRLDAWRGLGRRSPVLATAFALFLLAFAGIPLTSGFIGKFAVFGAAIAAGAWPLAVVGIACSAAAAFFYARVIVVMFFAEPAADAEIGTGARTDGLSGLAIGIAAVVTVLLGVFPAPILDFAANSAFIWP